MSVPAQGVFRNNAKAIGCACALALVATLAFADPIIRPEPKLPPALPSIDAPAFPDRIERFVPQRQATTADDDRREAMTLFGIGRLLEQRGDAVGAITKYERAFRLDPKSPAILDAIVQATVARKRLAEAARYAEKITLSHAQTVDAGALLQVAAYVAENGQAEEAIRLFEIVLEIRRNEPTVLGDAVLWVEMARLYRDIDKPEKSAEFFRRVAELFDNPKKQGLNEDALKRIVQVEPNLWLLMGDAFLAAKRPDDAAKALAKARAGKTKILLERFDRARLAAARGQSKEALAELEGCLKPEIASQGAEPYELLAELLKKLNREGELLSRLEKLRDAQPDNHTLGYFLAGQYFDRHRFADAESLYQTLLKKDPVAGGYRKLAEIYRETGDNNRLIEILGDVAEKTLGLEVLEKTTRPIRKDPAKMNAMIESARRLRREKKPLGFGPCFGMGLLTLEDGRLEAAGEFFEAATAADEKRTPDVCLPWGVGLLACDQAAESVRIFQRAIDSQPNSKGSVGFYFYVSGALTLLDRFDDALKAAEKASSLGNAAPRFLARPAMVLYSAKRYREATEAYSKIVAKFKNNYSDDARQVVRESKLILSHLVSLEKKDAEAEEWLEQVLDEFPDDISAMNDLGYLWTERGYRLDRALKMIEKAVKEEPENGAYRDSLGWAYFKLGRHAEAVAELEKAVAAEKPDPTLFDHLGDAYKAVGKHDQAKEAWRKAVQLFRKEKEADKAKQTEQKINQPLK